MLAKDEDTISPTKAFALWNPENISMQEQSVMSKSIQRKDTNKGVDMINETDDSFMVDTIVDFTPLLMQHEDFV